MYAYQFEKQLPDIILRWYRGTSEPIEPAPKPSANHSSTKSLDTLLGPVKAAAAPTVEETKPAFKICQHCGKSFPYRSNKKFCKGNCRKEHWDAAHPKQRKAS